MRFQKNIKIFDIQGRLIAKLYGTGGIDGNVYWNGRDMGGNQVASGVYFCRLENGPERSTRKMLLIK